MDPPARAPLPLCTGLRTLCWACSSGDGFCFGDNLRIRDVPHVGRIGDGHRISDNLRIGRIDRVDRIGHIVRIGCVTINSDSSHIRLFIGL